MKTPGNPRFIRCCLLILTITLVTTTSGSAALLSAVSATSDMGGSYGTSLTLAIDGSGLTPVSLTGVHDPTIPGNSWISDNGDLTGDITFDLGGLQAINGFSFWNQNDGGPERFGVNGIQAVMISSSTDGNSFNPMIGAPTVFAQEFGQFSSAQQFSFATVNASFIRLTVLSNFGDPTNTGFAEVQFNTAAVPDAGSSLVLLGISLLGLGGTRRWTVS